MAIALGLLCALVAVVFVSLPFFSGEPEEEALPAAGDARRRALELRKLEAYRAIKDAELDHRMGKLSDADLAAQKSKYTTIAVDALAELDAMVPAEPSATADDGDRFCPQCGTQRPSAAKFCPGCGQGLAAAA